jgi:hypothetical protein
MHGVKVVSAPKNASSCDNQPKKHEIVPLDTPKSRSIFFYKRSPKVYNPLTIARPENAKLK